MLSRVAESLYWMARYLERAENTARLINSTTQTILDLPRGASFGWDGLLRVAGLDKLYGEHYGQPNEDDIMRFLIADERNPSSIVSCIHIARENTRTFREVLPMEIWERINSLYLYAQQQAPLALNGRGKRYEVLNGIIERRQSVIGLLIGSMSQDLAYQFIKLGRNIERADMTTRIVDVNSAVRLPDDAPGVEALRERLWMNTLNALSAYQMYRQHVGVHVNGPEVVRFLLTDAHFPRTLQHCLAEIESCLTELGRYEVPMGVARMAWRRLESIRYDNVDGSALHDVLDHLQADLGALHAAIIQQYFTLHQQPAAAAMESQSQ